MNCCDIEYVLLGSAQNPIVIFILNEKYPRTGQWYHRHHVSVTFIHDLQELLNDSN